LPQRAKLRLGYKKDDLFGDIWDGEFGVGLDGRFILARWMLRCGRGEREQRHGGYQLED